MASRLLNVRLSPEDAQLVKRLRARGISVSEVMRRALRAEANHMAPAKLEVDGLISELAERYPTPARPARKRVDTTDRHAVRAHVRSKLARGR